MKNKMLQSLIFIALLVASGCASMPTTAVEAQTNSLITTQWLEKNLKSGNMVIIDVRTASNYAVGHIPGAFNIPYNQWEPLNEDRECQLMATPDEATKMLQAIGMKSSSHVIIYDQGNAIGDATKGCATVWMLEALGKTNVSYLDGGFTKWTFEGRILDNKKPQSKRGSFVAHLDPAKVTSLQQLTKAIKRQDTILVDARNSNQHFGDSKRGDVERFGHIPTSISLPAPFLNHAGVNRAPAVVKQHDQLAKIVQGVGIPAKKDQTIIVYCNTGQYAGMDYFVLHDILGYSNVSVYDGSMLEYAADDDLPMVNFSWGRSGR